MKEIIFFSNNQNKILEISILFSSPTIKILNLNNYDRIKSPKEDGNTFEENAKIKSSFGLKQFNKMCFADDSGICIKAINGLPGVKSKEYLGPEKNKKSILKKIISLAKQKNSFNAYFQTTICLSINKDKHIFFTGKVYGKISNEIKGLNGFGYDPIFIPNKNKLTFGEMNINQKNLLSHRSKAIKKLKNYIDSLI